MSDKWVRKGKRERTKNRRENETNQKKDPYIQLIVDFDQQTETGFAIYSS